MKKIKSPINVACVDLEVSVKIAMQNVMIARNVSTQKNHRYTPSEFEYSAVVTMAVMVAVTK